MLFSYEAEQLRETLFINQGKNRRAIFIPEFEDIRELTVYLTFISNCLKVNCAGSGKNICKKVHVRFLPTIRVFRHGTPLGDYTDDRTTGKKLLT